MDYFDLSADAEGRLGEAFVGCKTRFCVISFSSDWCFTTAESRQLAHALNASSCNVSCVEIESDKGHDAFLLDEPDFHMVLSGFIEGAAEIRGLK
jgi:homoserine O-acetyltransferase